VTTLELSEILDELARILRKLPDSELGPTGRPLAIAGSNRPTKTNSRALNGISLARMSKYPKSELMKLIEANQIPLVVRSKDSTENVLRRLRAYLKENSVSKRKIRNQVAHGRTSPELTSALSYLLKDRYE
jgi:hypothetical protein